MLGVVALSLDVGLHVWLVASVCELEGYVKKVNDLLLASIVIFRPFDLNTLLTSLGFSISFGVALQTARPSSRYSPTSSLNLDAIKERV